MRKSTRIARKRRSRESNARKTKAQLKRALRSGVRRKFAKNIW